MKLSFLNKVYGGNQNLGPIKRVLPCDKLTNKIENKNAADVAIRQAGRIPSDSIARNIETGGVSGCAKQLSKLIECLKLCDLSDESNQCIEEKNEVEKCRQAVKKLRIEKRKATDNRTINGSRVVNKNQLNRLLSWFPEKSMPRTKYDNEFTNYYIANKYMKKFRKYKAEP